MMAFLSYFLNGLFGTTNHDSQPDCPNINPASGLPMMSCSLDVEGNPYGTSATDFDDTMLDYNNPLNVSGLTEDHHDCFDTSFDDYTSHSWDD
ncbi:MAG: hypothetical protein K0U21_04245 [Proteobacteria bacterium]|nr:hypothetical protein [Pseudomonadota bacterium]